MELLMIGQMKRSLNRDTRLCLQTAVQRDLGERPIKEQQYLMVEDILEPLVRHYKLFPTLLVNLQYEGPAIDELNHQLATLIETEPCFQVKDLYQLGNETNMNDLATGHSCMSRVLQMFARGIDEWLHIAGLKGREEYTSKISTFPSILEPGQATAPHFHRRTELVGIYYVSCAPTSEPLLKECSHEEWYKQDDGPLWLLDSRFNATLTEVSDLICAKLFPRPGLLTIFPGYLWHGVGPNLSNQRRFAIAANISITATMYKEPIAFSFRH
jgi:hypothetical protein